MKKIFTITLFCLVFNTILSQKLSEKFSDISNIITPSVFTNAKPHISFKIVCSRSLSFEPLWIVDGILYENYEIARQIIDPNDIENITVLKDSSVLIQFSCKPIDRGIIVVTTKQNRIRKFIIKDFLDGSPVIGATVTFISANKKDIIMEMANERGFVITDKLKSGNEYEIKISAIGYKRLEMPYKNLYKNIGQEILLERDEKVCSEVVIASISYNRKCYCGGCYVYKVNTMEQLSENKEGKISLKQFKLYPNPIKSGATLNIEWQKNEIGNYKLELFNLSGQLIFGKEMWIDEEEKLLNIQIPQIAAGNYFLRMTNKTSAKAYTEKIIIQ